MRRPCTLLALGLLAALAACGGRTVPTVWYRDLVTNSALRSSRGEVERGQFLCAEITEYALVLHPGETLTASIGGGPAAELVLSGCLEAPEPAARAATLEVEIAGNSTALEEAIELSPNDNWWSRSLDLGRGTGGRGELRLTAALEPGSVLYLRDCHLRREDAEPALEPGGPQILLISVDTMRADGISALGGGRPTPNLDRLVAESEAFTRHWAADSWTKPSHAGLLTGQYPDYHRCRGERTPIHPAVESLAERFRRAGFTTSALVHDCAWLDPKFGFAAGFEEYRVEKWQLRQAVRAVVDWIADHRQERFFFFFHTYDVHSDFHLLPYEGIGATQAAVEARFGVPDYGCRGGTCASRMLKKLKAGRLAPLGHEAEILRYLYDCGLAYLDAELGILLDDLEAGGLADNLMIVLTGDHGEALLDHGLTLHGTFYEEVLRTPLVVKWPHGARAGTRMATPVNALDVAPTVLAAAGLPHDDLPGADLASPPPERVLFAGTAKRVVIDVPFKAIFDLRRHRVELYNLRRDPGEEHDLAPTHRARVQRMRRLLQARMRADREAFGALTATPAPVPTATLETDEEERLRALGYLASTAVPSPAPTP